MKEWFYHKLFNQKDATRMYHTTGLSRDQILEIVSLIHAAKRPSKDRLKYPETLGLFNSVRIALTYLRRNARQVELAEYSDCSQATISRAITGVTPWIERVLRDQVPLAEELPRDEQLIVDGTLAPCWSWASRPELYSGKHMTTGVNLQVVCDLAGRLRFVSDPVPGRRHDAAALDISGLLDGMKPENWIGDKGYIGRGMITPIRKPPARDFTGSENKFNTAINKVRWMIERSIATLKTWHILHIDYRRPFETFASTISTVLALEFFRMNCE